MHLADVVVIGPAGPLFPRPVRIRLGWLVAGASLLMLAAAFGALVLTRPVPTSIPMEFLLARVAPDRKVVVPRRPVQVVSHPTGAVILLDGREVGRTPATVDAAPADVLTLRRDGFLDTFVAATSVSTDIVLWRTQPDARRVRPPVPGAAITSANFLPDGRVALAVQVSPHGERQAWAYDPASASLERLGRAAAPGALPSSVAIAPDGLHTAAIVHLDGLDGAAADRFAIEGPDGIQEPLAASALVTGERLLDVSWSPTGEGVLLLSQRQVTGGTRFGLRFVEISGAVRQLAELPAQPLAMSWAWAGDGHAVAFLVRTKSTALATLDVISGELRYIDDLATGSLPSSGAVAPATWDATGRLLYAAPLRGGGSSSTGPVLFGVAAGRTDPHRVGDVEPVFAPIVRDDGVILTLARSDNDVLVLRPVDPNGHVLAEQRLGLSVSGAYAARWDLAHGQLLILGASGTGVDVQLLRFARDGESITAHTGEEAP